MNPFCRAGLDPPFYKYFTRVLLRTFRRLFGLEDTCAPGCKESFRECFFSRKSILLWTITHHKVAKDRFGPPCRAENVSVGGKWRRLGDLSEVSGWLEQIRMMRKVL